MKFCTHCGAEIMDAAVLCPKCGCMVDDQEVKYCRYCGSEVLPDAAVCVKCGCPVRTANNLPPEFVPQPNVDDQDDVEPVASASAGASGLQTVAKVFMVISCVLQIFLPIFMLVCFFSTLSLIYLVPFVWTFPMTIYYFDATKNNKPVGVGFKVCALLFVSLIAGILMLCDHNQNC